MEMKGQLHAPSALRLRKQSEEPFNRTLGGPQSQMGPFGEERRLLTPPGFEPGTVQPVAYNDEMNKHKGCRRAVVP